MTDQFVAEIRITGFNFPPVGWAFCDGQLLPISQYAAVFSLLGTFYGGNGTSNFALPNFQGIAPVNQGQSPGLSEYFIGQTGGEQTVTLLSSEMPAHRHTAQGTGLVGDQLSPGSNTPAVPGQSRGAHAYATGDANATLAPGALSTVGGTAPHNNLAPYLTLNFIIALTGIYPSRS